MDAEKILIRGPNWVGDAVLAIPALKAIRNRFPESEITLLVRPWVAGLFTSAPFVDKVWSENKPRSFAEWKRITQELRFRKFDIGVLLPNSFESALMLFLGRVSRRIGYATDGRRWMLTTSVVPQSGSQHQTNYYLNLVKSFGSESAVSGTQARQRAAQSDDHRYSDAGRSSIEIEATVEERANARKLLSAEGVGHDVRYLVLNAGAAYGSAKRWHEDRFAAVADTLASDLGLSVALIGSEKERVIAEQIRDRMKTRAALLTGKTSLETLIGVLAESSLMITNDSGPMHIAAALGVPTVAIFGSTDEKATGPCGPKTRVVKHHVDCSPCLLRECPIDHRCMTGVTPQDVCRAARELLNV